MSSVRPLRVERVEHLHDLRVDLLVQVGVEAGVVQLALARQHVARAGGEELAERRVDARLRREVVVDVRRQVDRQILRSPRGGSRRARTSGSADSPRRPRPGYSCTSCGLTSATIRQKGLSPS